VDQRRIGRFILRAPHVFRNTYEVAWWYQDVEVPPGEYQVWAHSHGGRLVDMDGRLQLSGGWTVREMEGVVVRSCFDALWGSYPVSRNRDQDQGQRTHARLDGGYLHDLAQLVAEDGGRLSQIPAQIILDGDIEARRDGEYDAPPQNPVTKPYDHTVKCPLYGLFVVTPTDATSCAGANG
jgi:hypothetical protein